MAKFEIIKAGLSAARHISVVVPTLNEAENVDALIGAVLAEASAQLQIELLIADGGSTDGTIDRVRAWEKSAPVRLIQSDSGGGLAGDVLAAARQASSDIVVVMDADFSHPAESIPDLVAPILAGTADMVIGSRYVRGGSTPGWPLSRRLLSRIGGALAWPLSDVRDPMSGFFAVRRDRLLAVEPGANGFKIGLEVMAAAGDTLRVTEIPIAFVDRERGTSKIDVFQMAAFARRLMVLSGGAVSMGTAARFAAVGVLGLGIDFLAFTTLLATGTSLVVAHFSSFVLATVSNYTLNSRWSFSRESPAAPGFNWLRYARFLTVCLLALFLRGGILATAVNNWGWRPNIAILLGIAAGAAVNFLGSAFFVFPSTNRNVSSSVRWRVLALGILVYVLALRFVFLGSLNLFPEEAYYWNYAQHLDIGYLDHPPMVAWVIWIATSLAGNTEFAVRIGAFLSWFVALWFCFQLTQNLYGKTAAFVAALLFGTLPFFFATGLMMTPDAPLTAAWAGALYFLERALIGNRRSAWWGVGLCMGFGLLSKYTIALLAPATLAFILLDPSLRRWLRDPLPYMAALIATLIFSPVLIWNFHNDWASFAFQGTRRLEEPMQFSLHLLIGSILVLLTPVGLVAAVKTLRSTLRSSRADRWDQKSAFITVYTLVPLSVFAAFSLFHEVKLEWTGPLWIALLPAIAYKLAAEVPNAPTTTTRARRAWIATVAIALLTYGAALHYMVLGLPGVGYGDLAMKVLPIGWKEFGEKVEDLETHVEQASGKEALVVGMDRYFQSSEISFYDPDRVLNTAGRNFYGFSSLMYDRWFSPAEEAGRDIVFVSWMPITARYLSHHFQKLGPQQQDWVYKDGAKIAHFYYRVGYGYRPH